MSIDGRPTWVALSDDGPVHRLAIDGAAHVIVITADPSEFAVLLASARPRVAILATPAAGGTDIQLALRERRRRPSMRVVMLSAPTAISDRLDALRAGVDEALPDTIDPAELGARIMILDAQARTRRDPVLPVTSDATIDLVSHEVRRAGELVRLRPKEFQLLAMLAANPGRAYSRRQLLDRVWGQDHEGDPRTVDVHVRWLRSKLERRPDAPVHIATVRGVGYRLDPDPR